MQRQAVCISAWVVGNIGCNMRDGQMHARTMEKKDSMSLHS